MSAGILWSRLKATVLRLLRKNSAEQSLADELQSYVQHDIEARMGAGMAAGEARRAALVELGGIEQVKDQVRDGRAGAALDRLQGDVRYALRSFRRTPGFTAVGLITLALGIGANTAIFSMVNFVLLQPLPLKDPDRLVTVWSRDMQRDASHGVASGDFLAWRDRQDVFEELTAYRQTRHRDKDNPALTTQVWFVTPEFFSLLGSAPMLGRTFGAGEREVALLSHGLWQTRFGADPSAVGRTMRVNNLSFTVIGVMPSEFFTAIQPLQGDDIWTPAALDPNNHGSTNFRVIARLRPAVTVETAAGRMSAIAEELGREFPRTNARRGVKIDPLRSGLIAGVGPILLILMGCVTFVLLIAVANLANLQLSRAFRREREIAIRAAIGASRSHLIRQVLTESLILALIGGAIGVVLAFAGVDAIRSLLPPNPRLLTFKPDWSMLAFTAIVSVLCGVFFGVIPMLSRTRPDVVERLKDGGYNASPGRRQRLVQKTLVGLETALALVLMLGVGLLVNSLWRLTNVDPGFDARNLAAFEIDDLPAGSEYASFYEEAAARLTSLPGVESVGAINVLPLSRQSNFGATLSYEGGEDIDNHVNLRGVSASYFQAMRIPILKGRGFDNDAPSGQPAAIVSEALARRFWPDADPIGKRVKLGRLNSPAPWAEVIGIVPDIHEESLDTLGEPQVYFPLHVMIGRNILSEMSIVVRTRASDAPALGALREMLGSINTPEVVQTSSTMDNLIWDTTRQPRFRITLFAACAGIAVLLAVAGIYGMVSYAATQRTHEIGVRIALGAGRSNVILLMLRQAMMPALAGLTSGILGGTVLTRSISRFLYGIQPTDPATYVGVFLLLVLVTVIAAYIPARRAAGVNPTITLRCE